MKAPAVVPTTAQLVQAHTAARLSGPLNVALNSPLLARCLEITARALANQATQAVSRPPVAPSQAAGRKVGKASGKDFKRACAADLDE